MASFQQGFAFFFAVTNVAPDLVHQAAGEHAIGDFQHVGTCPVNAQHIAHMVGEIGETTRDQKHFHACCFAVLHQISRAWVQAQTLCQHLLHVGHRHTFEQGHALSQALFVIGDLTTHGRFGDRGHFAFATSCIGNLVDTFDVDQCRIHVEGNQFELQQGKWGSEALNGEAGGEFGGLSHHVNQMRLKRGSA